MNVVFEPTGEEIDEITKEIEEILVKKPPKIIKDEKCIIKFYIKDFDKNFCIFEKIYNENNNETDYVFVFQGCFKFEGVKKEEIALEDLLVKILKNQPPEILKGNEGFITIGDQSDIIITEKTINKGENNNSQYSFIIPGFYTPYNK